VSGVTPGASGDSAGASGSGPTDLDGDFLAQAVALARENVASGGGPFGAIVVRDGAIIAVGQNRVTRDLDPTAHAEVVAIRAACRAVGDFSLAGATLYTSCEPCPLCLSASLWSRLDRVVFAADRYDAARGGFDDLAFYELFARDRSEWEMVVEAVRPADASAPFDDWLATDKRTDY
jgi:guanine deaminase